MLLFTLGVSMLTGIIAAVLPAVSRRIGTRRAAMDAGPRTPSRRSDLRRALIVAEVAASFMLLIGAGLMVRSLVKLTGVDPGFRTDHVLTMQIDMNFTKYRQIAERATTSSAFLRSFRRLKASRGSAQRARFRSLKARAGTSTRCRLPARRTHHDADAWPAREHCS